MNYAIRISRCYNDLSGVLIKISETCQGKFCVVEHEADEDVSRTHIHGVFMESSVTNTDNFKNWIKKALAVKQFPKTDWAFSTTFKKEGIQHAITENTYEDFIVYMLKGSLTPSLTNISEQRINELRNQWVDYEHHSKLSEKRLEGEKPSKETQFQIIKRIRERAEKTERMVNTDIGVVYRPAFKSVDNVYKLLIEELESAGILAAEYQLDRWMCTILRVDDYYSSVIKSNICKKYEK